MSVRRFRPICQFLEDGTPVAVLAEFHEGYVSGDDYDALRSERDEAVRKYEERVRQHEEYIAFADEEITGLIEKKRMVLVSLDEAVALLREAAPHVGRGPVTKELRRRIDDFLAPDSASHRENERG